MAIGSTTTHTIDAVTRLCYYQGASPATWLQFVRQVAASAGQGQDDVEKEVTDSLLELLSESENPSPVLISYLQDALRSSSTLPSAKPLIRPSFLARAVTRNPQLSLPSIEVIFSLVNAEQHSYPKEPCYLSSTPDETAQGLIDIVDNLLLRFNSDDLPDHSMTDWINRFIDTQTRKLNNKTVTAPFLAKGVQKVQSTLDALSDPTKYSQRQALIVPFNLVLGRLSSTGNRRRPHPVLSNPPRAPEIELFLASFLSATPRSINPNFEDRLLSILRYRQSQAEFSSTSSREANIQFLSDLLNGVPSAINNSRRSDHVKSALVLIKLPKLLGHLMREDPTVPSAMNEALQRVGAKRSQDGMQLDDTSGAKDLLREMIVGLCREGFISPESALQADPSLTRDQLQSPELNDVESRLASSDSEEIKQVLSMLSSNPSSQATVSRSVCETISSHAESSDLDTLAILCEALISDPTTLEVILAHEEPKKVLAPIRETLDSLNTAQDNFGESSLIERYGTLVLFIQIVVHRFDLVDNLSYHLGSSKSFLSSWIPTSSAAYHLQGLDEESKTAVGGFVAALFGDGISDDLMHATNPRTLLRVAPTILKQSLVACQQGVVDLDSLKDALSYFLQELLSFTLPGVLQWLIREIERTPPSSAQAAMYDILQVIIFAETLPRTVLELVSVDLASLILSTSSVSPPPFDLHRAKTLIGGMLPRPSEHARGDSSTASWSKQLQSSVSKLCQASLDTSGTDALQTRQALDHLLRQYPSEKVALQLLTLLLNLVPSLPNPQPRNLSSADETNYALYTQVERVAASLFSDAPLLRSLVNHVVPSFLVTPLFDLPAQSPIERAKVEMLSDIIGGAFILAINRKDKDVTTQLDRLARSIKSQMEKTKSEKGGDVDNPTLLRVFLERFSSYESLRDTSEVFSKLSLSLLS